MGTRPRGLVKYCSFCPSPAILDLAVVVSETRGESIHYSIAANQTGPQHIAENCDQPVSRRTVNDVTSQSDLVRHLCFR